MVFFAFNFHERLVARITQHLAPVKLQEINCLRRVAVGLGPCLRNLINHPRRQLVLAFPQDPSYAKQEFSTLFGAGILPCLKRVVSRLHRLVCEFLSRFLETTNHLGTIGWIDAVELCRGLDSLAANHQRIFAVQLTPDLLQRCSHSLRILFFAEIGKRFISKFGWHG